MDRICMGVTIIDFCSSGTRQCLCSVSSMWGLAFPHVVNLENHQNHQASNGFSPRFR